MKTKLLIVATAAAIGLSSMAKADELFTEEDIGGSISANFALTSEYFFRGITQSGKGNPAAQGGIDFAHNSGVYLGTWASSINFGGNVETDFYGGWSGDVGEGVGLDVGAILYHYPSAAGDDDLDYWEGYAGVSKDFGIASAGAKFSYSPEWTGQTGEAWYIEGNVDVPAGKYFTINLHAGYQWFDDNTAVGFDDYSDYLVGVSFSAMSLDFQVAYVDTSLSDSQNADMGRLFATVSKSF